MTRAVSQMFLRENMPPSREKTAAGPPLWRRVHRRVSSSEIRTLSRVVTARRAEAAQRLRSSPQDRDSPLRSRQSLECNRHARRGRPGARSRLCVARATQDNRNYLCRLQNDGKDAFFGSSAKSVGRNGQMSGLWKVATLRESGKRRADFHSDLNRPEKTWGRFTLPHRPG